MPRPISYKKMIVSRTRRLRTCKSGNNRSPPWKEQRGRGFLSCSCHPGRRTCPLCFSNRLVNAEVERPFMISLNKFEQKSRERVPACSKNVRCCCDLRHFSFCRDPSTVMSFSVESTSSEAIPKTAQNKLG